MARKQVVISVKAGHAIAAVEKALATAGLDVESSLEAILTITGSVEAKDLARLARVPGVAAVEEAREFQLPPPDSGIQ